MKKLFVFISAIALSLSFLTGCSLDDIPLEDVQQALQGAIEELEEYDISENISEDLNTSGIISGSDISIGKHDISDKALKKAEEDIKKDGVYTTPATVAAYIHMFNKLPSNFITKKEAQQLGWNSSKNYVSDVAPGKSIGGDNFGNREGLLPKGKYRECDINYKSGKRGAERIIYSSDGDIYYTDDHYNSFTQLY